MEEEGVLSNLLTPNGQLIDNEGQVALLTISGRSGLFTFDGGRLFPLPGMNPNTGILLLAGVGSVHHRVHFENTENPITQLDQPYLSGYDRLTWGVAVKEFVGSWHMSDTGLDTWFGGLEFWQARTWPQRPMNFDTQEVEEGAAKRPVCIVASGLGVPHLQATIRRTLVLMGGIWHGLAMRLYRAESAWRRRAGTSKPAAGWPCARAG